MPEGPEAKILSLLLNKYIKHDTIINITAYSKNKKKIPKKSKIISIQSKGKVIYIETKDYFIHIHLGISGWIYINEEPKYTKYIIKTNNNIIYIDSMRKFTKLDIYNNSIHQKNLHKLGIDILSSEFTIEYFNNTIKSSNSIIAS
jgi:formamidopyrimidine-DNA glycosylase